VLRIDFKKRRSIGMAGELHSDKEGEEVLSLLSTRILFA
jgi:hypothetical protein